MERNWLQYLEFTCFIPSACTLSSCLVLIIFGHEENGKKYSQEKNQQKLSFSIFFDVNRTLETCLMLMISQYNACNMLNSKKYFKEKIFKKMGCMLLTFLVLIFFAPVLVTFTKWENCFEGKVFGVYFYFPLIESPGSCYFWRDSSKDMKNLRKKPL